MEQQVFFPNIQPAPAESINTEGVTGVGEINSRTLREAVTAPDYTQAYVAGAVEAYGNVAGWVQEAIRRAGPYDDTRALVDLIGILGDKIREVHSRATAGATGE
jgi:hypothetical protein